MKPTLCRVLPMLLTVCSLEALASGAEPSVLVDFGKPLAARAAVGDDARLTPIDGGVRVETGRKAPRPGVVFRPAAGRWDMVGQTEVVVTLRNPMKRPLPAHCAVESPAADRTTRTNCVIASVVVPAGATQRIAVALRSKIPAALRDKLGGMRGTPGGFRDGQRNALDAGNVAAVAVYLYRPASEATFEVLDVRTGAGGPPPAFPLPKPLDSLFPMIDRFGQYIHKDWPGKTHDERDLAAAAEQERADLAAHPGPADWNRYGGWLGGPKLQATGRFRVEKWRDRWWFVDPEGRLFWSHGLVRVTWSSGYTPTSGREHLFAELPPRNSALGAFYGQSTWAIAGQYARGTQTFNFSGANLLHKYGAGWQGRFSALCHARLRSWGLNTMANCSQPAIYLQRKTPYTATVYPVASPPADTPGATGYVATIHGAGRAIEGTSGGWGKFPDVFDPSFKAELVKEVALHQGKAVGDPWCLGYFPGNELNWGADDAALGRAVLASPADQPAKRALIGDLKTKYASIDRLNAAWNSTYPSWEAMLQTIESPGGDGCRGDLADFLGRLADAYFRQCREAVKAVDPGGLYLGCRFAGWSHAVVFRTAARYSDVVSVNRYTETLDDLRLPDGLDKPVVIGEFHFGALDRGKFHPSLREVADQDARGAAYEKYVRSALAHPLVVGTHWHQFSDQATTGRDDGENFQNGFTDVCDLPYRETVEACRRVGYELYPLRAGAAAATEQ